MTNYELIEQLLKVFDQLDEQIGYLKVDQKAKIAKYVQQNLIGTKIVTLPQVFFDFKSNGFIRYSTIKSNKYILAKLLNYKESLITMQPFTKGFRFRVYNMVGELIYCQEVRFYDKTYWFQKLYLVKKFPELVLGD